MKNRLFYTPLLLITFGAFARPGTTVLQNILTEKEWTYKKEVTEAHIKYFACGDSSWRVTVSKNLNDNNFSGTLNLGSLEDLILNSNTAQHYFENCQKSFEEQEENERKKEDAKQSVLE